jgi:dihydrolipoamide dehydrogenase
LPEYRLYPNQSTASRSAEVVETISHASDYGVDVKDYSPNFKNIIKRSRGVADKMSKGVQFLMKANKIEVLNGTGVFKSSKELAYPG